ncbi:MAG: hypothetical protein M1820_007701 [Bogoriella megaspora]|nr:MAG: hypothetical protein M1820_007701 [Bogoriella megaspora]
MTLTFSRHTWTARITSVAALLFSATSSALATYLAVVLPTVRLSTKGVSLAAAVIDLIGFGCLAWFVLAKYSATFLSNDRLRLISLTVTSIVQLIGFITTFAMLGLNLGRSHGRRKTEIDSSLTSTIIVDFVLTPLAAISYVAFAATQMSSERPSNDHETLHSRMNSRLEQYSETSSKGNRQASPPVALQDFKKSFTSHQERPATTYSSRPSTARGSWRSSTQRILRPITSKTKLVNRLSFRDSKSVYSVPYSETSTASDGFDSWDTSTVDQHDKETVLQSRGTNLEPIPGSRPASPARALDGPFPERDSPETMKTAESQELTLPPSPTELRHQRAFTPPAPSIRSQRQDDSGASTPDESHIHPLFRSDSPAPPSVTSPETIITASPEAGQTISKAQIRARSTSRPTSPSPLVHTHSFDSTIFRDSGGSVPPIPGFVLAEGTFAGSEPRGRTSSIRSPARSRAPSTYSQSTRGRASSTVSEVRHEESLLEE